MTPIPPINIKKCKKLNLPLCQPSTAKNKNRTLHTIKINVNGVIDSIWEINFFCCNRCNLVISFPDFVGDARPIVGCLIDHRQVGHQLRCFAVEGFIYLFYMPSWALIKEFLMARSWLISIDSKTIFKCSLMVRIGRSKSAYIIFCVIQRFLSSKRTSTLFCHVEAVKIKNSAVLFLIDNSFMIVLEKR